MNVIDALLNMVNEGMPVATDTRQLPAGAIYFALRGESFNGNAFAVQALEKGAHAVVVDDPAFRVTGDKRYFFVPDSLTTLQHLATKFRLQFNIPVIAITGTNGKTTTKELLTSVFATRFSVLATSGNLNNHIGVPLTILGLKQEHEMAIIEIGASGPGEIGILCDIARPTAGLITNIGKAHIEGFGSIDTIERTKAQLYDFLSENGGDSFIPEVLMQRSYFATRNYPGAIYFSPGAMKGRQIRSLEMDHVFPTLTVRIFDLQGKSTSVKTNLFGSYNFDNLVNVIKIADHFGMDPYGCKTGLEQYVPSNNRSQWTEDDRKNMIVLDAYNANPSSLGVALDHFLSLETGQEKWLILGDMLELGPEAPGEHLQIIRRLAEGEKLTCLFVGEAFEMAGKSFGTGLPDQLLFFRDNVTARAWWKIHRPSGALIFVKGSRGIALERIFKD